MWKAKKPAIWTTNMVTTGHCAVLLNLQGWRITTDCFGKEVEDEYEDWEENSWKN